MNPTALQPFDADAAKKAVPVYFVKEGLSGTTLPDELVALAKANNFNGEAGNLLANAAGVLLGVGNGSDALISAGASDKLPKGEYRLAAALPPREAELFCLGWLIGAYRFDRYKSAKQCEAVLIAPENVDVAKVSRAANATALVRDLVNTPAGDMTPAALEEAARSLAEDFGATVDTIVGDDLLQQNFPMVHAVGRAADVPPRLIDMRWGREDAPKVTLVGKGVTFDSGGLNIKGGAGMSLMKKDMGGGAHVLGLAQMIMAAGLDVRLRVLVPAVENAISGNAFRPSDILPSRKGISVEIGNTDAEGRLILGDALTLGAEEEPDLMVSLATLTGAARVALGPEVIPFYTDSDDLAAALSEASAGVADPLWRMPLWSNYDSMLSSNIADVNHISGNSFAGSVIAALFLKRFVDAPERWVHFDLYAWRPRSAPGRPVGAECQAIRALFDVIAKRYN